MTSRDRTTLTVEYKTEQAWTAVELQRRAVGGAWTTATSAGVGTTATRTFLDTGRVPDSRTCYRVKAVNGLGSGYSAEKCGLTTPALGTINPAVTRLQLRVEVADVSDAGSGDSITTRLNSMSLPAFHFTPLNPAPRLVGNSWIDSFARNTTFTYELSLGSIRSLRDITEISLRNTGADALCVERIDLLVNGGTAMTKNFGATCRNIETESGSPHQPEIVIPFEELRATSSFTGFVSPGFAPITRGEVEARLEGLVGEKIWNTKAKWGKFSGNRAVEASRTNASTLHVDLDLEGIINNLPNVEVDVDFDLVVALARSGAGWNLTFDVTNIVAGADFPWWTEVLGGSLGVVVGGVTYYGIEALERHIEEQIQSSFTFAQVGAPFGDAACPAPSVPFVTVNVNAGLDIGCTL